MYMSVSLTPIHTNETQRFDSACKTFGLCIFNILSLDVATQQHLSLHLVRFAGIRFISLECPGIIWIFYRLRSTFLSYAHPTYLMTRHGSFTYLLTRHGPSTYLLTRHGPFHILADTSWPIPHTC